MKAMGTKAKPEDAAITALSRTFIEAEPVSQPRARGAVTVSAKLRDNVSVLGALRQSGSMKVLFPRNTGAALDGALVNTAGGVTGGDELLVTARAETGTEFTVSTQTAERAYRAQPGEVGRVRNHLVVEADARLNWLPQETILFQGSDLDRRLDVALLGSARLLLCEPLVFGRAAMGETLTQARFQDRISITQDSQPLFVDGVTLQGDVAAHLAQPNIANGAGAMFTLIYIAPDAEAHLKPLRKELGDAMGASLIRPELLFLRALAPDSFVLRKTLIPVLTRLLGGPLPRPWII